MALRINTLSGFLCVRVSQQDLTSCTEIQDISAIYWILHYMQCDVICKGSTHMLILICWKKTHHNNTVPRYHNKSICSLLYQKRSGHKLLPFRSSTLQLNIVKWRPQKAGVGTSITSEIMWMKRGKYKPPVDQYHISILAIYLTPRAQTNQTVRVYNTI